jgi:selenium metabolism protein YedF
LRIEEIAIKEIDCRGKACPHPVLMTKQALEGLIEGEVILIVDNAAACENVERFAKSQGCPVTVEKRGCDFHLRLQKGRSGEGHETVSEKKDRGNIVVYLNSRFLGIGDEALGSILMRSFLKTLLELETKPKGLILIHSGVWLSSEGSDVLDTLRTLSEKGVEILSCGTCLDFYGLKEKLKVGVVSNMYTIAQTLLEADRVVKP